MVCLISRLEILFPIEVVLIFFLIGYNYKLPSMSFTLGAL